MSRVVRSSRTPRARATLPPSVPAESVSQSSADGVVGPPPRPAVSRRASETRRAQRVSRARGSPRPQTTTPQRASRGSCEHPRGLAATGGSGRAHTQHTAMSARAAATMACAVRPSYAARPVPSDRPTSAIPTGTISTNLRANKAPACRDVASRRRSSSRTRSSMSASSRRSTPLPPTWWATSSVSQITSLLGSASSAFSTPSARPKSVDACHSRCAAANASRTPGAARRPASKRACGIGRPAAPASTARLVEDRGPRRGGAVSLPIELRPRGYDDDRGGERAPLIAAGSSAPNSASAASAAAAPTATALTDSPVSRGSASWGSGVRRALGPGITPFQRSARLV